MNQTPEDLERIQVIQQRITTLRELEARYAQDTTAYGQQQLARARQLLGVAQQNRDTEQQRLVNHQTLNKEQATFAKSYAKLSSSVKAQLQTQSSVTTQTSIYKSLAEDIAKSKAREASLTGDALDAEMERGSLMTEINASYLSQAKSAAKALDDAAGLTEFDKMRRDLKETTLHLSEEERKKLEDAINATEQLYKKEQRLKSIQESQKGLYDAMPQSLRSGVDFAKKLGDTLKTAGAGAVVFTLLAAVITAAVASFTALDTAAKDFRTETGLTNSQMEGIKSDANEIVGEFANLGVEAKNVFDTVSQLKTEFGDIYNTSKETTAALTVLSTNFGVTAENAAKVQGVYERMGGISSETAANLQLQAAEMAKMAGVAPAKVAQDIADAAEESYKFFKGDVTELTKAAIQARRLGTSLKDILEVNKKLLDFEGSIEDELVAATFANGQFNLTQARTLAASGKQVEAQQEILKQVQRGGDFRQKDLFTQEALAKASGMEVSEIIKQLDAQEKLASLSTDERAKAEEAIRQGLDITDINKDQLEQETAKFAKQQEQQATLEQISNQFMGIVATLGANLVPLLELALTPVILMADGLNSIVGFVKEYSDILSIVAGVMGTIFGIQKGIVLFQKREAILRLLNMKRAAAMAALSALSNPVKAALGIAAAGLVVGAASAFTSKAGDVMSPADGKTVVSTKEGGLFELSPNDDLVAAPGAADAFANASANGEGGINVNVNLSQLAAPLAAMINEIKGLRADMASGKIGVYMDTEKVTSKIGRQVDQSTRNNYSLGQA
jgi:hypothetical protein